MIVNSAKTKIMVFGTHVDIPVFYFNEPKVPIQERICQKCDLSQVEDEIHFLIICPHYDTYRSMLFSSIEIYNHDIISPTAQQTFINILQNDNPHNYSV